MSDFITTDDQKRLPLKRKSTSPKNKIQPITREGSLSWPETSFVDNSEDSPFLSSNEKQEFRKRLSLHFSRDIKSKDALIPGHEKAEPTFPETQEKVNENETSTLLPEILVTPPEETPPTTVLGTAKVIGPTHIPMHTFLKHPIKSQPPSAISPPEPEVGPLVAAPSGDGPSGGGGDKPPHDDEPKKPEIEPESATEETSGQETSVSDAAQPTQSQPPPRRPKKCCNTKCVAIVILVIVIVLIIMIVVFIYWFKNEVKFQPTFNARPSVRPFARPSVGPSARRPAGLA